MSDNPSYRWIATVTPKVFLARVYGACVDKQGRQRLMYVHPLLQRLLPIDPAQTFDSEEAALLYGLSIKARSKYWQRDCLERFIALKADELYP